jgi:NADH-quinone oxidoreductase subunit J
MAEVMFFIAGFFAVAAAIGVVMLKNPFYSVLSLVVHLLALAALFLLLYAPLIAAGQVIVYAGAVMVLYLFVVSYVGGEEEPLGGTGPALKPLGILFGIGLFVELTIATVGTALSEIDGEGAKIGPGFGSPGELGVALLERFLLPFEVASFLLFVATIGAIILARRRRGLPDAHEITPEEAEAAGLKPPIPQTMTDPVLGGRTPVDPHEAFRPGKGW